MDSCGAVDDDAHSATGVIGNEVDDRLGKIRIAQITGSNEKLSCASVSSGWANVLARKFGMSDTSDIRRARAAVQMAVVVTVSTALFAGRQGEGSIKSCRSCVRVRIKMLPRFDRVVVHQPYREEQLPLLGYLVSQGFRPLVTFSDISAVSSCSSWMDADLLSMSFIFSMTVAAAFWTPDQTSENSR